ncbi:MAG: hypothetical protein K0S74_1380 [Chlamydiales bacterium]|jgi:hypothetical protein|nr:hypothetical protein [Chlamydiales bacterium]
MKKNVLRALSVGVLTSLILVTSGCSVIMASAKRKETDLSGVRVGAQRGEIELYLHRPVRTEILPDGQTRCFYMYKAGGNPSAGRAIGHGALDLVTLGLWEVAGTSIEAASNGSRRAVAITYTADGVVSRIESAVPSRKKGIKAELAP